VTIFVLNTFNKESLALLSHFMWTLDKHTFVGKLKGNTRNKIIVSLKKTGVNFKCVFLSCGELCLASETSSRASPMILTE